MTAEIAVMNRFGVALAADSAVTVGSNKIFNTADKLFALSRHYPVGIMVYGNAHFMHVPWETVVKVYRKELGEQCFDTLHEYAEDFFQHILTEPRYSSSDVERQIIGSIFAGWLEDFLRNLNLFLHEHFNHDPSEVEVHDVFTRSIDEKIDSLNNVSYADGFDQSFYDWFAGTYYDYIAQIVHDNVKLNIEGDVLDKIVYIAASLICSDIYSDSKSGIVIAGFGEYDIFPSLHAFQVDGIFNGVLKYKEVRTAVIGPANSAEIVPFAQQEMVHAFLTGIDPGLRRELNSFLKDTVNVYPNFIESILKEKYNADGSRPIDPTVLESIKEAIEAKGNELLNEYLSTFERLRRSKFISPIVETVASFPKEELAAMAEALVNLTSIKRKVTNQRETVGGPTDVAVISKGDGFIWIKRKHYFDQSLNHQYFNYLKR